MINLIQEQQAVWNNKKYKKVAFTEYGKCRLIIGELYESRYNS